MLQLYMLILTQISRTFAKFPPSVCPECEEIWKIKIDQVYGNSNAPNELFKDEYRTFWIFVTVHGLFLFLDFLRLGAIQMGNG